MVEISTLGAVIKQTYESQPNTNAFTDPEKSKLSGLQNFSGSYSDLSDTPVLFSGSYTDLTNQPELFSGNFSDLVGTPDFIPASDKGAPGGVAPLDASGLVPLTHLNVSGLSFLGAWNAETNTPTLTDGDGTVGQFYKVSVPGTQNLGSGGTHSYVEGDWVIYAGGTWQRLVSSETVATVNGYTGMVVLDASDVGALPDTYAPTWNSVTGKPTLVNSINGQTGAITLPAPAWDDITDKPNIPTQRGMMGPPTAAALFRRTTTVNYDPNARRDLVWDNVVYDSFGGVTGSTYVVPNWAAFARVTVFVRLIPYNTGGYLFAYVLRNGNEVAISGHPVTANTNQNETVISPIMPVSPGDVLSGAIWHNHGGGTRTMVAGATGAYMQIELFEALNNG